MPYGLVMDCICGMREREVVVRMGEWWCLSQGYKRRDYLGWKALLYFSVFAFETSTRRCAAGSWINQLIWKLSGECEVGRDCVKGHKAKDFEGFREVQMENSKKH